MQNIRLKIRRSQRESKNESSVQEFTVPFEEEMTVLDALNKIKDEQDGTLSYRWSCRMGICGSCGMMVNGRPVLTCQTYVKNFAHVTASSIASAATLLSSSPSSRPIAEITVEPLRHFPVIRDLVVDIDNPMEKFRKVMPWTLGTGQRPRSEFLSNKPRPAKRDTILTPHLQSPADREKIDQTSQCIKCMLCYSACPVYGLDKGFLGPAAGALAYRYQVDSREEETNKKTRMNRVTGKHDVWDCSFVGECSVVCPKRVDPALALQRLKLMGLKHILLS